MIQVFAVSQDQVEAALELRKLVFPGGEVNVSVQLGQPAKTLRIQAHLPNAEAVMTLLLVTDALRRGYPGTPIVLSMPYVPYARQDRVANAGEALSARVFCDLINAQQYAQVEVQDPHSDVVTALLDRVTIADPLPSLRRALASLGAGPDAAPGRRAALVAPDAGARKRVMHLAHALELDVVFAEKVRNTQTGKITGTQVTGALPDTPLVVVDDICDGGRTFTELAAALRARQAEQRLDQPLYLYVTHGIFSKGLAPLLEHYRTVFTRNNWTDDSRAQLV
ncbi:phosphoribosyltransferase family protein [Paraburkholderia sp. D15]|uniref:phosphoribosyltransferase family protein n=1 Tax=Paraburkholderia sp. D15 TaxID=2880218 RepID=UPI0024799AD4|nr:ribose-phosphate pyrophosphokinase-like domain-containing protein [Paraburkholderia sp. D15]WGS51590.1 phosphoribosyltransferase family protein [Paraburkholderia sp. D15]WKF55792.1 Ribose-phosphate pyrophosphokinase [Paraburkholderia busanensis]